MLDSMKLLLLLASSASSLRALLTPCVVLSQLISCSQSGTFAKEILTGCSDDTNECSDHMQGATKAHNKQGLGKQLVSSSTFSFEHVRYKHMRLDSFLRCISNEKTCLSKSLCL